MPDRKSDTKSDTKSEDSVTVDPAALRRIEEDSEPAAAKNRPDTPEQDD